MSNVVPAPDERALTSKLSGVTTIDGFFNTWVKKGSAIGEEFSKTFQNFREFKSLDEGLGTFSVGIYAYDGEGDIDWAWDESGNLSPNLCQVCTLKADLSGLQRFVEVKKRPDCQDFWKVPFNVNIFFGGRALKARMTWYEGVSISHFHPHVANIWLCLQEILREGPVSVIPNSVY